MSDRTQPPARMRRQPRHTPPEVEAGILAARIRSGDGPLVLGAKLGLPASTVGKVLRRLGHSRPPRAPREPAHRYEHERPGDLLHLDIKKLGRFWHVGKRILQDGVPRSPRAGWQYVHVAVDDHSRLAYVEVLPSERREDAVAFLGGRGLVSRAGRRGRGGGADRQRRGLSLTPLARGTARPPASGTSARGPTRHARTGRRSASSRPCSGSGPTATSTRPAPTVPAPSPGGCGGTTGADLMAHSVACHPSAVSHTSVVTTPSRKRKSRWNARPPSADRSAKMPRTLSWRATSYARMMPPVVGPAIVSGDVSRIAATIFRHTISVY